ncbi:MAG: hypothetical protein AAGF54_06365 [Pseudomonadota bacterium]
MHDTSGLLSLPERLLAVRLPMVITGTTENIANIAMDHIAITEVATDTVVRDTIATTIIVATVMVIVTDMDIFIITVTDGLSPQKQTIMV